MTNDLENFLSKQGVALSHAVLEGNSSSSAVRTSSPASKTKTKGGDTPGGSSDFDETKVKRDGGGKFAKQASSNPDFTKEEMAALEKKWASRSNQDKLENLVGEKAWPRIVDEYMKVMDRHGVTEEQVIGAGKLSRKLRDEMQKELDTISARIYNEIADTYAVSPSGRRKLHFSLDREDPYFVPHTGPIPIPSRPKTAAQKSATQVPKSDRDRSPADPPLRFNPNADISRGRVSDKDDIKHDDVKHDDVFDNFLAHHGIKGMRWGVRRSDAQLSGGGNSTRTTKKLAKIEKAEAKAKAKSDKLEEKKAKLAGASAQLHMDRMKPGETIVSRDEDGNFRTLVKRENGKFDELNPSADAESFMRTMQKDGVEMSTREMKEAVTRAQTIESYNKLMDPKMNANAELQNKVNAMKLQQEYSRLENEMREPSKKAKVAKFIAGAAPSFKEFKAIDDALDGIISKKMKEGATKLFDKSETSSDSSDSSGPSRASRAKERVEAKAASRWEKRRSERSGSSSSTSSSDTTWSARQDVPRPDVVFDISSLPAGPSALN